MNWMRCSDLHGYGERNSESHELAFGAPNNTLSRIKNDTCAVECLSRIAHI